MIDLHTHTEESDGTFSPRQLIAEAARIGVEALAITDHDTFAGYERAAPFAAQSKLDLVCGIEISTNFSGRSVHLLAYFLKAQPTQGFRDWIARLQASRRERNAALVEKLRARQVRITLDEVSAKGRTMIGRPHFAAVLVEKGYAASTQHAFDEYLDESASCYVSREEPLFADAVSRIRAAGGVPVLPHPGRVAASHELLERTVVVMRGAGLLGIEVYHSDHSRADVEFYASIARRFNLAITGGSDFHGQAKPHIALATGIDGNLEIPRSILDDLRRRA